jgi:hypothetical protein
LVNGKGAGSERRPRLEINREIVAQPALKQPEKTLQ